MFFQFIADEKLFWLCHCDGPEVIMEQRDTKYGYLAIYYVYATCKAWGQLFALDNPTPVWFPDLEFEEVFT